MAATAEAAKMAAEGATIGQAEAVKIAAGAAVSKKQVARVPNPAIRPLAPTAISILDPIKPRNAQIARPLQRRRSLPTPNRVLFWVVFAQTLGLGCLSPQALAQLWRHAAPRASGMKTSTGWQTVVLPKI